MANKLLSKIQIGGVLYDLKDAEARRLISDLQKLSHIEYTDVFATDKAIKEYVDAQVGAINSFEVIVADTLPTATAETMFKLYLVSDGNAEAGTHVEYITVQDGEGYKWEAIGSTKMDLADYVTETELETALADYTKTTDLGEMAFADTASGTVESQTIKGVKATGTGVTDINITNTPDSKEVSSNGKFTPAGTVAGTVVPSGDVAVTVSTTAADATLTKGDYTPAGTVSVSLNGNTFNAITGVGTQASFEEGKFTPADLQRTEVSATYAETGLVVDEYVEADEMLVFGDATTKTIEATKVTAFTGGAKAADTFVANSLPTMAEQTVGVNTATFTGTLAEDLVVTGVSYAKANAEAAATFTGHTNDITAQFTGTETDVSVKGNYTDTVAAAEVVNGQVELAVADIVVSAKEVTVTPDAE